MMKTNDKTIWIEHLEKDLEHFKGQLELWQESTGYDVPEDLRKERITFYEGVIQGLETGLIYAEHINNLYVNTNDLLDKVLEDK